MILYHVFKRFCQLKQLKTIITNVQSKNQFSTQKPQQQQLPARLPFLQENKIHLNQIFNLKGNKKELNFLYEQKLTLFKTNYEENQKKFKCLQNSIGDLYKYIKEQILREDELEPEFKQNSSFIEYAHYYFQKQGKKIRPLMITMMANSLNSINFKQQYQTSNFQQKMENIKKWAALIQILHIASLAHDDIIDDSPSRRGQVSQHLKYGKRTAVFSGNYIISKGSQKIYDFKSPRLFQIYSIAMDNLATGQIIQALTKNKISTNHNNLQSIIQNYMNKTYYKTAALMANALRSVPIICNSGSQYQLDSFRIGQHFGIAFQIVDDILDYISTAQEMGKQEMADIRQGNITAPIYFTLYDRNDGQSNSVSQIIKDLKRKNKSKQEALKIKQWVHQGKGIQLSYLLAVKHIQSGLLHLKKIGTKTSQMGPWQYLAYKLLVRRK